MTEVLTCTSKKLCEEGKEDKEKEIGGRGPIQVVVSGTHSWPAMGKGGYSNRNPMPDYQLQVGPCLTVGAYLEGSPVNTILDTGAGVSIIGRRFVDLYKRVYGRLPKMDPVSLTIKGVNS